MLYTKEIEKIVFQDVVDFCNEEYRETIHLDYKEEVDGSLAKTIAAMANTWGGLIIIGVEDEDSTPKLPVEGIDYKEHLREQVNNIILGNITPPVFPEIKICPDGKNKKAFIIIRVPQSDHSPHAIRGNTRVYVRTDTSNEPEEIATVDRILWLIDRRKKSNELKNDFYEMADKRFKTLSKKQGIVVRHTDAIFGMSPLYPFEILVDYRKLQKEIPEKIKINVFNNTFPLYLINQDRFEPTQNGAYGFLGREDTGYTFYEELNHYGFFYHREDLCKTRTNEEGREENNSFLWDILRRIDGFLFSALNFYTELGYWGILEFRISLDKLEEVSFRDLPPPSGYVKFDDIVKSPIDGKLEFIKILTLKDLKENGRQILIDLVKEMGWAIGFGHISSESIEKLLNDNDR